MVTGLKNSLQEQAVPGRQHCMGCNPPKKANCRAEQSLWGWEDAGGVKCSGTGSLKTFPMVWEFVIGCPEIFPAHLLYFGYLCLGVIGISLWFYHHLMKSGISFWHPLLLPARLSPKAAPGPWIVFQTHCSLNVRTTGEAPDARLPAQFHRHTALGMKCP